LALSEASRGHAIHGLTRWLGWRRVEQSASQLVLGLVVYPRDGYPFLLALEQTYSLSDTGLAVRTTARNVGQTPLPFGAGQHCYFTVGTRRVDEALLEIPARSYLTTDERLIPVGRTGVAGTPYDYRSPRLVGAARLDTCFADLLPDADGNTRSRLTHPTGAPRLTFTLDPFHSFVQVYTGDTLDNVADRRRGLAVEPMTCAPNAFNSGDGLRVLAPSETFSSVWSVAVR
jgi:aldose 1-epimerase